MIGACKMSFREPGKSDFSPITTSGVLTKQILISKGIRYHDNTKTYDTFRYEKTKSLPRGAGTGGAGGAIAPPIFLEIFEIAAFNPPNISKSKEGTAPESH